MALVRLAGAFIRITAFYFTWNFTGACRSGDVLQHLAPRQLRYFCAYFTDEMGTNLILIPCMLPMLPLKTIFFFVDFFIYDLLFISNISNKDKKV